MAHGTGSYMIRKYDLDIQTEEYAAIFFQERYYWYPQMSDCYEPTSELRDNYEVEVIKWRTNRYGHKVADCASDSVKTGNIDKDTANKIYWNLKNRNISYETCRKYFTQIAGRELHG
jgi:hypothetical protein